MCYLRRGWCDWTGRRQNWLTVWQAPCLARGAALLERGGPLRGGGGEGRGLPLVFGSMSGTRAVRCGVGLRGEAARRVGLRGGACAKGAMRRPHVHAYIRCTYSPFSRV